MSVALTIRQRTFITLPDYTARALHVSVRLRGQGSIICYINSMNDVRVRGQGSINCNNNSMNDRKRCNSDNKFYTFTLFSIVVQINVS